MIVSQRRVAKQWMRTFPAAAWTPCRRSVWPLPRGGVPGVRNSHAAHLAYGDFEPRDASLASLLGPLGSERRVAGPVMDFVRNNLRIASFDHRQQAERGAGSREQEAIDPHPRPLSRDQRSVGARRGEQELERKMVERKMSVLLAPIFPIFLSFIFLSVPLLNGTSDRQRDRQQAASGYRLSGPCLRIRYASRRDHLPWEWTGPDRRVARPCDVRCRRLGADGRRNFDDRRTAVRGRDGSRDCRSPGGSRTRGIACFGPAGSLPARLRA